MAHILIVEDDELLAKALADGLGEAGFSVVVAGNADKADAAIVSKKPDLIYLDIMLPGESGYDILAKLKADPDRQNIPVVMLTNLGQMSEVNKAMDYGAKDYIVKANIDLEKLVELTRSKYLTLST